MSNDLLPPPEINKRDSKVEPIHELPKHGHPSSDHLGIGGGFEDKGIFASLFENVHDALFPKKLPPLVLSSKPVAVPDRMKVKRSPASTAAAIVLHALIILFIAFLFAKKVLKFVEAPKQSVSNVGIPPIAPSGAKAMGGGGGNNDTTPASKGKLPPPTKVPKAPMMHPIIEQPKLPAPMALVMQDNLKLPNNNMPNFGDPNAAKVNGPGSLGSGGGGGIGEGHGGGLGPGFGGNYGGGVYQVGGGVSAPTLIYGPEAEFSDEARRAKYQGEVDVDVVVGPDGLVKSAHVLRDPGMGLAQNALNAVRTYRFKPSTLNGKPVAVRVTVQVGFTIY